MGGRWVGGTFSDTAHRCARKLDRLIQCDNVLCDDIRDVAEGCNVASTSEESEQVASDYISRIIDVLTHDHVLAFTNG